MKLLKIFPLLFLISMMSGCFGTEPNDIAYIVALGFDKAENDNYDITIQFANPTQISGGSSEEGGKVGAGIVENVVVEAPNIYAGINLANHVISKEFSLSHAKLVVFSSEVAKEGVRDIMETIERSYDIRPDVYMAVADEGARKYLTEVKPVVEVNPAKFYQLIYEKNKLSGIPQNTSQLFYFNTLSEDSDNVLPLAGVLKDNSEESQKSGGSEGGSGGGESGSEAGSSGEEEATSENVKHDEAPINNDPFEYKIRAYRAGEVAIYEKNKSESIGMAIFKGDKMLTTLSGIETELYNMLNGHFTNNYITFYTEKYPHAPTTIKLTQKKLPEIKIDLNNQKIDIKLSFESDLYSLPADYVVEKDISHFEKEANKDISNACTKFLTKTINEYDVDLLGLSGKAKSKFLDINDYNNYNFREKLKNFDISIDTELKIRRTNLTIREKE